MYCNAKGYKVDGVVTEIGSGLNDCRPKLEKILLDKTVTHIVIEHKDRIARFGLNYITKLMELDGQRRTKRKTEKLIEILENEIN